MLILHLCWLACSIFTGNVIPTRLNFCWSCKFSSLILVFYSNACTANMLDLKHRRTLPATLLITVVNEINRQWRTEFASLLTQILLVPTRSKTSSGEILHNVAKTTTERTCWLIYTDFNIFIYRWTIDILSVGVFKMMQYFFSHFFKLFPSRLLTDCVTAEHVCGGFFIHFDFFFLSV